MAKKYEPVKVSISFEANPEVQQLSTEELGEGNFQWVAYGLLFKVKGKEEYYAYSGQLTSDGNLKEPISLYKSDSEGVLYKDEDIDIIPEYVPRFFSKLFKTSKRPDLTPAPKAPTIYRNTYKDDKGNTYSSEKFKQKFDKDYYVVVTPKNEIKNPFGKVVGKKGVPEETEQKEEEEKQAYYRKAVRFARKCNQNKPFPGGFDIMKKFQEQQTGRKIDPGYSGGFNILQRWQKQRGKTPAPSRGFDIVRKWQREQENR